jgi:hypothetical protein
MASKFWIRDGGLDSGNTPNGYTVLGSKDGELVSKSGDAINNVSPYNIIVKQELDLSLIPYVDETRLTVTATWSSTFPFLVGSVIYHHSWDSESSSYIIIGSASIDEVGSTLLLSSATGTFSPGDTSLRLESMKFGVDFLTTDTTPVVPDSYINFDGCATGTFSIGEQVYYIDGSDSQITLGTVVDFRDPYNIGSLSSCISGSRKVLLLDLVVDPLTLPDGSISIVGVDSGASMDSSISVEIEANFPFIQNTDISTWTIDNTFTIPQTIELPTGKWIINKVLFTNGTSSSVSSFSGTLYKEQTTYMSLTLGDSKTGGIDAGVKDDVVGGFAAEAVGKDIKGFNFNSVDDYFISDVGRDGVSKAVSEQMTFAIDGDISDPSYTLSGKVWIYIYGFKKPEDAITVDSPVNYK